MFYSEACEIVLSSEATFDELLEALKIIAIEHGYRCCEITYNLRQDKESEKEFQELEFLKLLGSLATLQSKIKEKFNNGAK